MSPVINGCTLGSDYLGHLDVERVTVQAAWSDETITLTFSAAIDAATVRIALLPLDGIATAPHRTTGTIDMLANRYRRDATQPHLTGTTSIDDEGTRGRFTPHTPPPNGAYALVIDALTRDGRTLRSPRLAIIARD
jgi:hypothetical protein